MPQIQRPNSSSGDLFRTSDLATSAFLVVQDLPLLGVDWDGHRAIFLFPGVAQEKAKLYRQPGRNLVEAYKFHQALRELRGLARDAGEGR